MTDHSHHMNTDVKSVRCFVLTVSDTRTRETDESGKKICALLEKKGHAVKGYEIIEDDPKQVQNEVKRAINNLAVDVAILNGGTGISPRDSTYDAIRGLFSKEIPGFGELFRTLSYQEIGPNAYLSRCAAGMIDQTVVFSLPGSTHAVALAMDKLILPTLGHLVGQIQKGKA